jgi:hypothetical protein
LSNPANVFANNDKGGPVTATAFIILEFISKKIQVKQSTTAYSVI